MKSAFLDIIDISWPISEEMTPYKKRRLADVRFLKTWKDETWKDETWKDETWKDDSMRSSRVLLDSHAGTHIDAPAHFLKDGKTIDQIALSHFYGECIVLDFSGAKEMINKKDLEKKAGKHSLKGSIILLKTRNSKRSSTDRFWDSFIYLERSGAKYLAEQQVKAVGIDYLGIERDQPKHDTHKILLSKNIPIIEGLRLAKVRAGTYHFLCLPLAYRGLEAAPARAVLIV